MDEQTIRSLRGYYTWGGGDDVPVPAGARAKLRYKRFTMRDLWPERTRFDWSSLDAEFDRAARNGQLYALRLRAITTDGIGVPDWAKSMCRESVTLDSNKPIFVPNYTDPAWIAVQREFINQVAQHCAQRNPGMLALVDIGMLGRWGEGHFWGIKGEGGVDGTKFWMPPIEAQRAIVDAHVEAFGNMAWLISMTDPEDMLKYALRGVNVPRPIGWRRDSLGNPAFDNIGKNSEIATLLKERAKVAPVITEFFGPSGGGTNPTLARQQAKAWGIWLVSNGNLAKDWSAHTAEEQAALLALGDDLAKTVPTTDPGPITKPPAVDGTKLADVLAQVQALQAKVDALTTLVQSTNNLTVLQTKIDAITTLLQAVDLSVLQAKVDALAAALEARTDALEQALETRLDALAAQLQQERRFVIETTVREVAENEHVVG